MARRGKTRVRVRQNRHARRVQNGIGGVGIQRADRPVKPFSSRTSCAVRRMWTLGCFDFVSFWSTGCRRLSQTVVQANRFIDIAESQRVKDPRRHVFDETETVHKHWKQSPKQNGAVQYLCRPDIEQRPGMVCQHAAYRARRSPLGDPADARTPRAGSMSAATTRVPKSLYSASIRRGRCR